MVSQATARLGSHVKTLIKDSGKSQKEVAKLSGLSQPDISNIMNDKLAGISIIRLLMIANALSYDVEILVLKSDREVGETKILEVKEVD